MRKATQLPNLNITTDFIYPVIDIPEAKTNPLDLHLRTQAMASQQDP